MYLVVGAMLIAATTIILSYKTGAPKEDSINEYKRQVYVGAWAGNFWDNKTRTLDVQKILDFENNIQHKVAITNLYIDWTYLNNPELLPILKEVKNHGWTPMISSNPSFYDKCPENEDNLYKSIANGNCDELLVEISDNLKEYDNPIFLRFAWEMNLPDMYWSVQNLNSTPEDFKAAWIRFHDITVKEGANNIIWVLSFNTSHSKTIPYVELYPGDQYVDWVAIDGYNWGNGPAWSNWTSFHGVFINSYNELINITDKPVMLSEVNSASDGDKALWLKDMLEVQIPNKYENIKALIFFNENKEEAETIDWRLEKDPTYLEAVSSGLNKEIYRFEYP